VALGSWLIGLVVALEVVASALPMRSGPGAAVLSSGLSDSAGDLTQLSASAGCLTTQGARRPRGCSSVRGIRADDNLVIALSADDRHAYVAGGLGLAVFERDVASGALTQLDGSAGCFARAADDQCGLAAGMAERERHMWGIGKVQMAPDDSFVYVTQSVPRTILAFARDQQSGELRQLPWPYGCITALVRADCARVPELPGGVLDIAVSSDGGHVYVAGRRELRVFERGDDGELLALAGPTGCVAGTATSRCATNVGSFMPSDMVVSPDGNHLYVISRGRCSEDGCRSSTVHVLRRNLSNGRLMRVRGPRGCLRATGRMCAHARGIRFAGRLALSPDGRSLYVSGDGLATFRRARRTGALRQIKGAGACFAASGCRELRGVEFVADVTVSDDGQTVYVGSSWGNGALMILAREPRSGRLRQRPDLRGCIDRAGREGCATARISSNPSHVTLSNDGRSAYVDGFNALGLFARR
jgi:6-phosphogluconolactonase (cycloisomerase 2 family)